MKVGAITGQNCFYLGLRGSYPATEVQGTFDGLPPIRSTHRGLEYGRSPLRLQIPKSIPIFRPPGKRRRLKWRMQEP